MKRIYSLALVIVIVLSLCACGGANAEIGTTYTSEGVEFTLNYVEFTEAMDNWGGANDTYWMPLPKDASGHRLENALTPKSDDDIICVISYTAKNVSKNDKTIKETGTLNYDGYIYDEGGLSYRVSPTGVWKDIPSGLSLKKLTEDSYEFRAYMVVPKVVTETDKSLIYELFGKKFDLR